MTRVTLVGATAAALAAVAVAGCGKAAPGKSGSGEQPGAKDLKVTTTAATKDVGTVTWALYRDVQTLDPIQAFDYPDNTAITALCDSLLRQNPDGTISPGLATITRPDPKTALVKLRDGLTFSDGKPVTAEDVAFSLQRAANPKAGSFYGQVFTRVASIQPSGADEVTLKLKQPDSWLDGELSQMPGIVVEKAYVESKGRAFGTPSGGTSCVGAFKVKSWQAGAQLSIERNDAYWDAEHKAKAKQIDFKGVPDDASLTSGLLTGGIDGGYPQAIGSLSQLEKNKKVTVSFGPSFAMDAIVISSLKGPLGDVRVRRALSMAVDRKAYIQQGWHGAAQVPRDLSNPGMWGYAKDVFQKNFDSQPEPKLDVAGAKKLMAAAGAKGKTITLGMTTEVSNLNTVANAIRSAGASIGLKVRFKSVSAANFINFFTDPKAREGVDAFPTVNYPDYADPAAFYATVALPDGSQNYDGFSDAKINAEMAAARSASDPAERAKHVVAAGNRIGSLLPWIPMAAVDTVLITRSDLTGAPSSFVYMGGPWANAIGGSDVGRFAVRRGAMLVVALLVSSFVIFGALDLSPGNPLSTLSGGRTLPPEAAAQLKAQYHLDDPFLVRYVHWLGNALHGDLGTSIALREPVSTVIGARIQTTLALVAYAALLIVVVGVGLGMLAGLRPGWVDTSTVVLTTVFAAVPSFVAAIVLLTVFAVGLGWFPAIGSGSGVGDTIRHLTLPAVALAISAMAIVVRVTRTAVRTEMGREHVQTAISRGIPYVGVVRRHVLRNAAIPVTTIVGITVTSLIALSAVVERAFGIDDGLGNALVQAALSKDFAVVQGISLVFVAAFVVANAAVDLLYAVLDPRVALGSRAT